jgi:transcriptional regulator with XRE-family HTH domain
MHLFIMKSPGDRLRELRIRKGYESAVDAARAFGWSENTYKSHEGGIRGIRPDAARRYATAFGATPAYIMGLAGAGEPAPKETINHVVSVPLVAKASAGAFRFDEGLEIEGFVVPAVPRADIPAGVQYAVIIDGPSVNLRIPDGAFAICAPYDSFPGGAKHGQLVHVVRERAGLFEHTIKRLEFTRSGMILMPCSTDPRFQEAVELSAPEDDTTVTIRGVVIGAYQPF